MQLEPDLPSSREVLPANPSLGKAKVLGPNPSQGCFCFSQKEQDSCLLKNADQYQVLPNMVRILPNTVRSPASPVHI